MDNSGQKGKARDAPLLRQRIATWLNRWGADVLLAAGALLASVGASWIYPPAGLIAGGVLLIAGGILWAKGESDP